MDTQSHARDFHQFWSVYPRKVSKADALKAWTQTANVRPPVEIVIARVRAYIAWRADLAAKREFVPAIAHAATWLRGQRWEDEYEEVAAAEEKPWHETASGIEAKGRELGIHLADFAGFPLFKSAVIEAVRLQSRKGNVVPLARRA